MKHDETVEIIRTVEGELHAVARWKNQTFTHGLPKGFETWSPEEQKAHMRRYIAPWLKTRIYKAKELEGTTVGALNPTDEFREVSKKFVEAEEKRQRKAEKLKLIH